MDISPFNTLKNCGNSSRLVRRIKSPMPVFFVPSGSILLPITRGSKSILNILPSPSLFSFISSALRASASIYILLNLYILNFLPFFPTRSWAKKIGPGELIYMAGATKINIIPVSRHPTSPPAMSITRLISS